MNIVPLTIVSSTILSVRLRAEMLPIDIIVKRPIIEDYFRLSSSSPQRRQAIVQANLRVFEKIAGSRYQNRNYTNVLNAMRMQMVIREEDLRGQSLRLPNDGAE